MIQHLQARRFAKPKEFDFPHKRAALMVLYRDAFFERCELS
jgi:acetyl CoA:N6-hydroxylysine acetyl transferase